MTAHPNPAPRAGSHTGSRSPNRHSRTWLLTWGTVGLVVVIVGVLIIVKVASPGTAPTGDATHQWSPLSSSITQDLKTVPITVYNKVGITSPAAEVTPPVILMGTPPLTINGKPGVFYLGGEFCPDCAAERWALTAALSRFGSFSGLGAMQSAPTDLDPNTQTMTYYKASLNSVYVAFRAVEHYSNVVDPSTGSWTILQRLTPAERRLLSTYYQSRYLPGVAAGQITLPVIDIGNKAIVVSASYSPSILQGLTADQIAGGFSDPTNPVTQAILSTANYLSSSICATDDQKPISVCASPGVTVAARALHLNQ